MSQVKLYAPFANGTVIGVDGLTYIVDDGYVMVYEYDVAALEAAGYVRAVPNEIFRTSLALPIGGGGKLFIHTCDLHYQSTNMATKNSAPNFYA